MTEKRFDVVMNEFDEVEYITDIVDCEDRDFADFIDFANEMAKENEELRKENIHLEDDLRYYKVKSASCEQGLIQYERELDAYKRKVEEILRKWYADANKLRKPIRKLDYGEDIGYWNGVKQFIEELSDKLGVDMMTERDCGHCKHFQIDGMFGMWCDINDTDYLCEGECLNFERS